jgi:hypothetical protein
VELILGTLPGYAPRVGKPTGESPARLRDHVRSGAALPAGRHPGKCEPVPRRPSPLPPGSAVLRLPAEAFIRLLLGRLDDEHTSGAETENVDLAALRRLFPGF